MLNRPSVQHSWLIWHAGEIAIEWVPDGAIYSKIVGLSTKEPERAEWLHFIWKDINRNVLEYSVETEHTSVGDILIAFFGDVSLRKRHDIRSRFMDIENLVEYFPDTPCWMVDEQDCMEYARFRLRKIHPGGANVRKLERERALGLVIRELNTLKLAAAYCARWRLIETLDLPALVAPQWRGVSKRRLVSRSDIAVYDLVMKPRPPITIPAPEYVRRLLARRAFNQYLRDRHKKP